MKTLIYALGASLCFCVSTPRSQAQGSVFTYQGRLLDGGSPANGTNYGMVFYLFDASTNGTQLGSLGIPSVAISNGLFTVNLSFGATAFHGSNRWLEITVQKNGGAFTTLTPRQQITPAPYAITAGGVVNSGSGLTNLNATSLTSGVVADSRLGTNVARLNAHQVFTGTNLFKNLLGVGPLPPIYPLDVFAAGFGLVHEDGVRTMATFVDAGGGWLGTVSDDPLNFFVNNDTVSSLTIDTNGFVGIGTDFPFTPLNVFAQGYGIEQDALGVSLSTFVDSSGGWLGTVSTHPLSFFVNDNATASLMVNTNGRVGIGTSTPAQALSVVGNIVATGTINGGSDRNSKENFSPIDSGAVLERVAALPISRWNYRAESDVSHLGPMAQDFYQAFQVGEDERHISMVDADGVALAAIQGLNLKLEEQIKSRDRRIAELEARLARLEKVVSNPEIK